MNNADKNKLYIGIFSLVIIIIIIIVFSFKGCSDKNSPTGQNAGSNSAPSAKSVSIVSEQGAQNSTLKADFNVRGIKFSNKIKDVKKLESNQKDTIGEPSVAKSQDGYTYLTYTFSKENIPEFFGTKVQSADTNSMLVYVFRNNELVEVRIQYGKIGKDAYNNIVANINTTYGNATYSRTYSNGTEESWWKTKKTTLDLMYQDTGAIIYYRANSK